MFCRNESTALRTGIVPTPIRHGGRSSGLEQFELKTHSFDIKPQINTINELANRNLVQELQQHLQVISFSFICTSCVVLKKCWRGGSSMLDAACNLLQGITA